MAFIVVYDACVLFPAPLRDLLVRVAERGLVQAKWTNEILDECFTAICRERPDLDQNRLARTRALLVRTVPDALVEGYEGLIPGLELPDPDDRHVLAAAIRGAAQTIVTRNLKDFPAARLAPYGIRAQDPDDFVLGLLNLHAAAVPRIITEQANDLKNPPRTVEDVLSMLEHNGMTRSVAELRTVLGSSR